MSHDHYDPNSLNAVVSRIETKLDQALQTQERHETSIRKLWAALSRLDVRVAVISVTAGTTVGGAIWGVVKLFSH